MANTMLSTGAQTPAARIDERLRRRDTSPAGVVASTSFAKAALAGKFDARRGMNSEVAAIRNELKGFGVRNSFHGATKNYMAELLNRRKHNTAEVPPQLRTAEALRMARSNEYRALIGKHSLKKLALHLPASLWKHYKKFGWLQLDLGLSEREKRMVALCHRVALCELVRRHAIPTP